MPEKDKKQLRPTLVTYKLAFLEEALNEWRRLSRPVRAQFKKKLVERFANPRAPSSRLSGAKDR
jgi:mRNA interferase RelE/StbE